MAQPSNPQLIEEMRWQLEKIANRKADNDRLIRQLDTADGELAALSVSVNSPDGAVSVQAGPGGVITDIAVTEAALRTDAAELSRILTATVRAAIGKAAEGQLNIVRQHVDGVDATEVLGPQARLLERHGPPAAEPTPKPAEPAGAVDEPTPSYLTRDVGTQESTPAPTEQPASKADAFLLNLGPDDYDNR
ncbi:YbaB/EbfC DNA-binding family protein [Tamaricihabitans halophyticus]|uniref:YbaB/EbfC DNA-binding family protein n=1 Tax=Tamaricihabitans halophyticus TaxID=1262583 RepID=A0A4R2R130_9PSEU|nr:YbaB/EbfC family nucleoid-associated protein [Tamaricihabitans halophyticus]TCP53115.1 YbaB/EbfC DNA-binding family protein [Tamaricihabitans halophyticus]